MLQLITTVNDFLNGIVWGPIMLVLLVGTGIYLTCRVGFIQFTKFGYVLKNTLGTLFDKNVQKKENGGITPFQAVATALASTVGTGNITGVATAIVFGGPGAVFWMWVSALFGMVTKYSEIVLAILFRKKNEKGEWVGGPMYYIEHGLNMKWLAVIFAFFAVFASFGIGNIAQANSVAVALNSTFGFSQLWVGIILAFVTVLVIVGGISRISKINTLIVPFMSAFYIIVGVIILILNAEKIPMAFSYIIQCAFNPQAVFGGGIGYTMMLAMRYGFARGVFSNEAGLGSAPIAHAAANTKGPVQQGLWGIFEVFFDTIIICTITGLIVVMSGLYTTGLEGADLAIAAFSANLGSWAGIGVTIAMVLFATSTIFGWAYYGEKALEYLIPNNNFIIVLYKVVFCFVIILGAVGNLKLVWDIADTLNGMMAIPNLVALLLLSKVVISTTKEFFKKEKLQ